jgi:hypothetical protein
MAWMETCKREMKACRWNYMKQSWDMLTATPDPTLYSLQRTGYFMRQQLASVPQTGLMGLAASHAISKIITPLRSIETERWPLSLGPSQLNIPVPRQCLGTGSWRQLTIPQIVALAFRGSCSTASLITPTGVFFDWN